MIPKKLDSIWNKATVYHDMARTDVFVDKINELIDYLQAKEEASKGILTEKQFNEIALQGFEWAKEDEAARKSKASKGDFDRGFDEGEKFGRISERMYPASKGQCKCRCHIESVNICCDECLEKHNPPESKGGCSCECHGAKENTPSPCQHCLIPPEHEESPKEDDLKDYIETDYFLQKYIKDNYVSKEKIKRELISKLSYAWCKELFKSLGLGD